MRYLIRDIVEQNSRIQWIREGDKNSKFFHNSLLKRRSSNIIVSIRAWDGSIKEKKDYIKEEITNYYMNLPSEPDVNRRGAISKIVKDIHRMVSHEHN
jgi:hypothetical protein